MNLRVPIEMSTACFETIACFAEKAGLSISELVVRAAIEYVSPRPSLLKAHGAPEQLEDAPHRGSGTA
jgi:hypothetical protein